MPKSDLAAPVDLLTIEQACQLMACSDRYMRLLIARRELPAVRFGRLVRVQRSDLVKLIAAHTEPALRGPLAN